MIYVQKYLTVRLVTCYSNTASYAYKYDFDSTNMKIFRDLNDKKRGKKIGKPLFLAIQNFSYLLVSNGSAALLHFCKIRLRGGPQSANRIYHKNIPKHHIY